MTERLHAVIERSSLFGHRPELSDEDVKLCLDFYGDALAEPQQTPEGVSFAFEHGCEIKRFQT